MIWLYIFIYTIYPFMLWCLTRSATCYLCSVQPIDQFDKSFAKWRILLVDAHLIWLHSIYWFTHIYAYCIYVTHELIELGGIVINLVHIKRSVSACFCQYMLDFIIVAFIMYANEKNKQSQIKCSRTPRQNIYIEIVYLGELTKYEYAYIAYAFAGILFGIRYMNKDV